MKLTSVELHPSNSADVCVMSFRDPQGTERFNVMSILGLDADSIVRKPYKGSGSTTFYNLSLESKQIVMKVGLNPRWELSESYSDLREVLYKMIQSSRTGNVQLQFKNGSGVVAAISGFVSKYETPHFDRLQQVQITIDCDEPWLKALVPTAVPVVGLDPANTLIVDNLSTAPHGFKFDVTFVNPAASIAITDPLDLTWSFTVAPAGGFLAGDVLHFSSDLNDKQLYLTRGGVDIQLADVIAPGSVWPILFPGDNHFAITNSTSFTWTAISYYPTYWGV